MKFDGQIVISILLSLLFVRMLGRFFNLPVRLPHWGKLLKWIWVPGVGLGLLALLFKQESSQLDEVYMLFVYGVIIVVLVAIRDYRPARTVLLAMVPYVAYSALELLLEVSGWQLSKQYDDAFDSSQGFAVIWLITFLFIARNQKKNLEKDRWCGRKKSSKSSASRPKTRNWSGR